MPEIRFYATKEDLNLVFATMRSELGLIAYEMVSEPGEPLRRFQTLAELSSHFRYCGKQCDFVWWDAESMPPNRPKKLKLDPEECDGHILPTCDGFSLDTVTSNAELAKLSAFEDYQPRLLGTERYLPYSHPGVSDNGTVAVFELDHRAARCICTVDFNAWNLANESSSADELLFWKQSHLKVQVVPWDGKIEFKSLSPSELKQLQDCERGISHHLYPA